MKTLLLLTIAAALHAAPILTLSGPVTATPEGYFFNLTPGNTATITSDVPLSSVKFFLDTGPNQPGSGVFGALDGFLVLSTPAWVLTQQWYEFTPESPFTEMSFWTEGGQERWEMTGLTVTEVGEVPEPSTAVMLLGWLVIGGAVLARRGR